MPLALSAYSLALALHVMAVLAAFGGPLAFPLLVPWVRRSHPEALAGLHDAQHRFNQRVTAPATVLILALGAYMATVEELWGEPWVIVPLTILIVIGGVGGGVVVPALRRLGELARAGPASAEYQALYRRYMTAEVLLGVLVLVAVFFMAAKPGA